MKLNLNKFLFTISYALDLVENEINDVSLYHSKRVAFISIKIAEVLNLNKEEQFDLYSYALLHDNGLIKAYQEKKSLNIEEKINERLTQHCLIGEENIKSFPFLTKNKNIILYHHEHYDGNGYYGKKGDEIPLLSQIIFMADLLDTKYDLSKTTYSMKENMENFIKKEEDKLFSKKLVNAFFELSNSFAFWGALEYFHTNTGPEQLLENFEIEVSIDDFFSITNILSNLIDSKSRFTAIHSTQLASKTKKFLKEFNFDEITQKKLLISANLHDIGKLATPTDILEKEGTLTKEELFEIKKHAYFTYSILKNIDFCDDILSWASLHHEKPDGSGYPFGLNIKDIPFEARIISCLDFYQALVEKRPYRDAMKHNDAISLMKKVLNNYEIDLNIIEKIDKVFNK